MKEKKLTYHSMMEDLRKSLGYSHLNDCDLDPCTSYHLSLRVSLSVIITWVMADLQNLEFRKLSKGVWYRSI
jgi:hypothetical protein